MPEPKCALCQGKLVKEKDVYFDVLGNNFFRMAWVCSECGVAFPIGMRKKWGLGSGEQLYENGKRFDQHP